MSTDHQGSSRAARIAAAVERESVRRKQMLLLYLFLLGVPITLAVYFGIYGHRDRELVNSAVKVQVEPIAADIVARELNTQFEPLIQTEVARKIEPLTADIRGLGELKNDVAVLVKADAGLRQTIEGFEDQIEQKNSEKFQQVEQTLTSAQDTLKEDLRREINAIGTSINEKFDTVNQRIGAIDSNPDSIDEYLKALNEKVRGLEDDKIALEKRIIASQKLRIEGVFGELDVVGGETTNVRVRLSKPATDTFVDLKLDDDSAWFLLDGKQTQSLRRRVDGDAVSVEIGAKPVERVSAVRLSVWLEGQPPEEISLKITPPTNATNDSTNDEYRKLRREIDDLRERLTARNENGSARAPLRIQGDAVWLVIGGRTTRVPVRFNGSVPRGTTLKLEIRDKRASFVEDGRLTQTVEQSVDGENEIVMIKASRVSEPLMISLSVQLTGQPQERAWLRIMPR